ncbi:MAG: NusG domain II-containing protein [Clostridia bacterium]|nr:NusG domain II-containing protein [Clostridia bacterium]
MKRFWRRDAVLFLSVLLIAGALFLLLFLLRGKGEGERDVVISYHNKVVARLPLEVDTEYLFECDEGYNRIVIEGGAVRVAEADCPTQRCVRHGELIPADVVPIFCIPHYLDVKIVRRGNE